MSHSPTFRDLRLRIGRLEDALSCAEIVPGSEHERLLERVEIVAGMLGRADFTPPPQLQDPEFLAQIFERAQRRSASSIGRSNLRLAFAPMRAPRDVAWREDRDQPYLAEFVRRDLPSSPRRDPWVVAKTPRRRAARLSMVTSMAAAMLVAIGAFVVFGGTSPRRELVFLVANGPLSADHPSDFIRGLIGR